MKLKLSHYYFLTALLFFFGCTSKEMKKAIEFMEASMYEQAISLLEIEIQANPKNAEASYLLGKCYIETSNQPKVEDCFKRAILLDTDFKEEIGNIYFDKSLEYFKTDNLRSAERFYEQGLNYNPIYKEQFAKQLFDYTAAFSETTTESDKPIELFTFVDNISPEYKIKISDKSFVLARSFIEKGFIEEGFRYADFGIKYDTKNIKDVANLYFKHGESLLTTQNKPNECFYFFEKCIKLNPSRKQEIGNIYYNKAQDFEIRNETNLLLIFAQKSVELNPDYNTWYLALKDKYKPKVPINGLIAYYSFNGNANDESGNGYNGTVYGASAATDRRGNVNSAYYFNGNNYIQTPLRFNSSHTISLWLKTISHNTGWPDYGTLVSTSEIHGNQGRGIAVYCVTNKINYGKFPQTYGWSMSDSENMTVQDNKWHHIVLTWDGTNTSNNVKLYYDGVLKNLTSSKSTSLENDFTMKIGYSYDGPHKYYYKGSLDDIRVYNRALSAIEITELFNE